MKAYASGVWIPYVFLLMRAAGQWVRRFLIPEEPGIAEEEEGEKEDRKMLNKVCVSFLYWVLLRRGRKKSSRAQDWDTAISYRPLRLPPFSRIPHRQREHSLTQPATQFVIGPFRQQPLPWYLPFGLFAGEFRSISRKGNGEIHVDWRKSSVAETICRIWAGVFINGVGSVNLSWYTGKAKVVVKSKQNSNIALRVSRWNLWGLFHTLHPLVVFLSID